MKHLLRLLPSLRPYWGQIALSMLLLLALTGAVTVAPLLLFSAGVRLIPLSTMGLLQYISPSLQFLSGILLFGEAFGVVRGVGFGLVWLALIAFSVENYLNRRKEMAARAA